MVEFSNLQIKAFRYAQFSENNCNVKQLSVILEMEHPIPQDFFPLFPKVLIFFLSFFISLFVYCTFILFVVVLNINKCTFIGEL